ncbi:thermonuclease family protein [Streptomyces sp. NBC_00536]|uniref:thermonuclease family protein n=1 Tax=Streptomyces sp. NBC_00536 TaxID=2975769 RepID=UPI002E8200F4|nr:thermonuclease family protein [Streptomyces sp. NBC_00536]WUC82321.1 thermonuclease family protein [Streptomyces sp. NBC_00536]
MSMLLVQGSYQVLNLQPDGDTVAFKPTDPKVFQKVEGCPVKVDGKNTVRLRLDAIDALETHYSRTGPGAHQPLEFAHKAAEELLAFLGFTDVRHNGETVTAATPKETPGFILTQGADKFGRCIALLGVGTPPGTDGSQVDVDVALLRTTANHHMLSTGLAYPTFYAKFLPELRAEMAAVAQQARTAGLGLWPSDVTTAPDGAVITGMSSLTGDVVILPKLFRRLVDHFNLVEPSLNGFPTFLAGGGDELRIEPAGTPELSLKPLVEIVNGGTAVRMTISPEDIVFTEG